MNIAFTSCRGASCALLLLFLFLCSVTDRFAVSGIIPAGGSAIGVSGSSAIGLQDTNLPTSGQSITPDGADTWPETSGQSGHQAPLRTHNGPPPMGQSTNPGSPGDNVIPADPKYGSGQMIVLHVQPYGLPPYPSYVRLTDFLLLCLSIVWFSIALFAYFGAGGIQRRIVGDSEDMGIKLLMFILGAMFVVFAFSHSKFSDLGSDTVYDFDNFLGPFLTCPRWLSVGFFIAGLAPLFLAFGRLFSTFVVVFLERKSAVLQVAPDLGSSTTHHDVALNRIEQNIGNLQARMSAFERSSVPLPGTVPETEQQVESKRKTRIGYLIAQALIVLALLTTFSLLTVWIPKFAFGTVLLSTVLTFILLSAIDLTKSKDISQHTLLKILDWISKFLPKGGVQQLAQNTGEQSRPLDKEVEPATPPGLRDPGESVQGPRPD